MLFLSVGMPRAGSGWFYNLNHDLVVAAGGRNAREIRKQYHLGNILSEVNCNIGALTPWRLIPCMIPALIGINYTIKAHSAPSNLALRLIDWHFMIVTYIYRDPRDAMLSAFENGQKAIQSGRKNAFSRLVNFETTLDFMREYVDVWEAWMACPGVFHIRYEDLLTNYDAEISRLLAFMDLQRTELVEKVVRQYQPEKVREAEQQGLHFRKGKIGRFRQVYTQEQQDMCMHTFGRQLESMGYPA